jgi:hypothetical protein
MGLYTFRQPKFSHNEVEPLQIKVSAPLVDIESRLRNADIEFHAEVHLSKGIYASYSEFF